MFKYDVLQSLNRVEGSLKRIEALLVSILKEEKTMSVELDALTAQVHKNTDLEQSAITLIQGLAAQIAANATDPVALKALTDELTAKAALLAAAITANTPPTP